MTLAETANAGLDLFDFVTMNYFGTKILPPAGVRLGEGGATSGCHPASRSLRVTSIEQRSYSEKVGR